MKYDDESTFKASGAKISMRLVFVLAATVLAVVVILAGLHLLLPKTLPLDPKHDHIRKVDNLPYFLDEFQSDKPILLLMGSSQSEDAFVYDQFASHFENHTVVNIAVTGGSPRIDRLYLHKIKALKPDIIVYGFGMRSINEHDVKLKERFTQQIEHISLWHADPLAKIELITFYLHRVKYQATSLLKKQYLLESGRHYYFESRKNTQNYATIEKLTEKFEKYEATYRNETFVFTSKSQQQSMKYIVEQFAHFDTKTYFIALPHNPTADDFVPGTIEKYQEVKQNVMADTDYLDLTNALTIGNFSDFLHVNTRGANRTTQLIIGYMEVK